MDVSKHLLLDVLVASAKDFRHGRYLAFSPRVVVRHVLDPQEGSTTDPRLQEQNQPQVPAPPDLDIWDHFPPHVMSCAIRQASQYVARPYRPGRDPYGLLHHSLASSSGGHSEALDLMDITSDDEQRIYL